MSHRKIEALGRPRRSDAQPPRLLALRQRHHFRKVAGTTESLFDCRDGLALLQRAAVGNRLVQQLWHSHRTWTKFSRPHPLPLYSSRSPPPPTPSPLCHSVLHSLTPSF